MKRLTMIAIAAALYIGTDASAAEAPAKPDCAEKQKASDDATAAVKAVAKADLISCKDKKATEQPDCEKPIKDKAKDDATAAKETATKAKFALAFFKTPKKKGCTS